MKKYLGIFLAAILCLMMAVAVNAADVYVNDGGEGDGSSAEAPLGDMTAAIEAIAAEGGTVHIVDTYTCADQFVEPAHAGNIVITGGKYVFTNGSFNRWYLSGEGSTTFENITFEYGAGSTSLIVCQFNELIVGENVVFPGVFMSGDKEVTGKCYILGGYQFNSKNGDETYADLGTMMNALGLPTDRDSKVTVKSGDIWCVAGYCRQGDTKADEEGNKNIPHFSGTANITVDGGHIATIYGGNINNDATAQTTNIVINGGTVDNLRLTSTDDRVAPTIGDSTVTVNDGVVTTLVMNNVLGKTVINLNGGTIAQALSSMDGSLTERVTDGTSTLNIASGATALPGLAMAFTTVNGEVASPVIPGINDNSEETTEAVADTTVAETVAETKTEENGGKNNTGLIIGVVVAIVVVIAIVAVVAKKKK